jgi:hypothetical protein
MERYEQMRKDRLEEHKKKDKPVGEDEEGEGEVHRATTVFHGIGGDQSGKGWVDPPSYLR